MDMLRQAIDNRIANLKSLVVKSDDYDYLFQFNADISSLIQASPYDVLVIYYLIRKNSDLEAAKREVDKIYPIINHILNNNSYEYLIAVVDMFLEVIEKYDEELGEKKLSDFLNLCKKDKLLSLAKKFLKSYVEDFSQKEVENFLVWLCEEKLADIFCLLANFGGIRDNLDKVNTDDLEIPDFFSGKLVRRLSDKYIRDVKGPYLKEMNKEFSKEIEELRVYKSKRQSEMLSEQRKINKQIKNLKLLLNDIDNNVVNLESLLKYKLDSGMLYLMLVELIKERNLEFDKNYKEIVSLKKDPVNIMEIVFDTCGFNFNILTKGEQEYLLTLDKSFIEENLNFIKTSSLKFLSENDDAFINILIQNIDVLMQLDSLLIREKISQEFILIYGKCLNSDIVKKIVQNVNKLDIQKVDFAKLENYNSELLLNLNINLLDTIIMYGINLSNLNLKKFDFLDDCKLLNIIDKYIEIGLLEQIQNSPNLITYNSEVIVKRIILTQYLNQEFLTEKNTLNQFVRNGVNFYLGDENLDLYMSCNFEMFIDRDVKELLDKSNNIDIIEDIPEDIMFIENYKNSDQVYLIGDKYYSRIKVLRCLKTLIDLGFTNYKEILFYSLIYNYPSHLSIDVIEDLKNIEKDIPRKQLI